MDTPFFGFVSRHSPDTLTVGALRRPYRHTGPSGLAADLAALVTQLELTGLVEAGLARAGIHTVADFQLVRGDDDFVTTTGLPTLYARKLYGAAASRRSQGAPAALPAARALVPAPAVGMPASSYLLAFLEMF